MVAGAAFTAICLAVLLWEDLWIDAFLRHALLDVAGPTVVAVSRVVNMAGDWRGLLPGTLLLFLLFPRARERWWLWVALLVTAPIMEWTVKQLVARARPESAAFGFPSGHSTAAAAFFGAVIYLSGSLRPPWRHVVHALAAVLMLGVGLARVILRAHWPSDVVAGFALGLALASLASLLAASQPVQETAPAADRGSTRI
jgi:undecaprenyl-diphosphatase